jgi:hypothetical protein
MRRKSNKTTLTIVLVIIVAFSLLGFGSFSRIPLASPEQPTSDTLPAQNLDERVPCINSNLPVPDQYHIHPHLQIIIDGKDITIPAGIGIELSGCERFIHTHDDTGTIHIEPNYYKELTLGDFFAVWGEQLSPDQVLGYKRDAGHEIVMMVDGKPSQDFGNLVLKDNQEIVLEYRKTAE